MYCFSGFWCLKDVTIERKKPCQHQLGLDTGPLSLRLGVNPVLFRLLRMGPFGLVEKSGSYDGSLGMGRVQVV